MTRLLTITLSILLCFTIQAQRNIESAQYDGYNVTTEYGIDYIAQALEVSVESIEKVWPEIGIYHIKNLTSSQKNIAARNPEIKIYPNRAAVLRNIPDDPMYSDQYYHEMLGIAELWKTTTGKENSAEDQIVLAVLDNGFNIQHEDLNPSLWSNPGEIPGNNIDDDNNDYIDDIHGYDFFINSKNIPSQSHGTGVMGIAGARGNNAIGITGVVWDAQIMVLAQARFENDILEALRYTWKIREKYNNTNGAEGSYIVAVNNSWGFPKTRPDEFPLLCTAFNELLEVGILGVVATPNSSQDIEIQGDLPSSCKSEGIISVLGVTTQGIYDRGSGYNELTVDIGAPTTGILTTQPENTYVAGSGTSYATPIVTGSIGLLYASLCDSLVSKSLTHPKSVALRVKDAILNSVTKDASLSDKCASGGYINVYEAYKNLRENCGPRIFEVASIVRVYPNPNTTKELTVEIELPQKDGYMISIYNMQGKKMKEISLDNLESEIDLLINISDFYAGTYVLELTGNGTEISKKFIVL